MLTDMPPETRFATGVSTDTEEGLFMANTGLELRWVAISGGIFDWAIYCHFSDSSIDWITKYGDKVSHTKNIRHCVPCDDEALLQYRK